jgi:GNAT superfamily N-acetyltransferase
MSRLARVSPCPIATRTQPGLFGPRTHELGQYIGIRLDGALAALAGERMRLDGCVEISAVCVRPDDRGKGYVAFLVAWLVHELRGQGVTPFLHAFTDNVSAIALYERRSASLCCRAPRMPEAPN